MIEGFMTTENNEYIIAELKEIDIERPVQLLYELHFNNIVSQICANGGNSEDGSDIFQDAVLILIEKVKSGQFKGNSSIKTFLSAIARNLWLFELRTRSRRKNRETLYTNLEDTTTGTEEVFFSNKQHLDLENIFNEIGENCKKILTGFYYEEKSMKELLVDVAYENEQVLRNKKSKCMKKLKELIQNNKSLMQNLTPLAKYER